MAPTGAAPTGTTSVSSAAASTLRERLLAPVATAVAGLASFALVGLVSPYQSGHYPLCPTYALLGLYCPACGGLRAGHDLAHLDLVSAWGMNPLVVLTVPVVLVWWSSWLRRAVSGRRTEPSSGRRRAWVGRAVVVLLVVFTVCRNVPALAPWLAPGL